LTGGDADEFWLGLHVGGVQKFSKKIPGSETGASVQVKDTQDAEGNILAEGVERFGGPWRALTMYVVALRGGWETAPRGLTITDAPPARVQGLAVTVTNGTARLTWQAVSGDVTGYIVGHRNIFGEVHRVTTDAAGATGMNIPVVPGKHSFSVAAKDALWDVIQDDAALNFCEAVEVQA
jgi:hypothetical protein